jgi:murein L,D-transpeptidase YafK
MQRAVLGLIVVFCLAFAAPAPAQPAPGTDKELQQSLISNEKQLWEGWKQGDTATFEKHLSPGAWSVGLQGIEERDQVLKSIAKKSCSVTSYSIDETSAKLRKLNENTVVLNYTGRQEAVCAGQKIPNEVYATSIYVREGGQWKNMFYTDTPSGGALKALSSR